MKVESDRTLRQTEIRIEIEIETEIVAETAPSYLPAGLRPPLKVREIDGASKTGAVKMIKIVLNKTCGSGCSHPLKF